MKLKHVLAVAAMLAPSFAYAIACGDMVGGGGTETRDLSTGGTVTVNNALLTTTDNQSTGTGVIQSFVRIAGNDDCKQGYNTDFRPLEFDENNSPQFTRDLPLSAVPIVTIDGIQYREFLLDINQNDSGSESLLTLNEVQIFVHNTDDVTGYGSGALATPVWSLDEFANENVKLDYTLNSGSGAGDLFLYVPNSEFVGGTFVTLFSSFGDPNVNNDGFEEWAVRSTETLVTEPGILGLFGIALLALGYTRRRRIA